MCCLTPCLSSKLKFLDPFPLFTSGKGLNTHQEIDVCEPVGDPVSGISGEEELDSDVDGGGFHGLVSRVDLYSIRGEGGPLPIPVCILTDCHTPSAARSSFLTVRFARACLPHSDPAGCVPCTRMA